MSRTRPISRYDAPAARSSAAFFCASRGWRGRGTVTPPVGSRTARHQSASRTGVRRPRPATVEPVRVHADHGSPGMTVQRRARCFARARTATAAPFGNGDARARRPARCRRAHTSSGRGQVHVEEGPRSARAVRNRECARRDPSPNTNRGSARVRCAHATPSDSADAGSWSVPENGPPRTPRWTPSTRSGCRTVPREVPRGAHRGMHRPPVSELTHER